MNLSQSSSSLWQIKDDFNKSEIMKANAIIEPPDVKEFSKKKYIYVIDSRSRNTNIWSDPSSYEINLDEHMSDVQSLELLNIDVPFVKYLINDYNNKFYINNDDTNPFVLDIGDYTGEELAAEITTKFRSRYYDNHHNQDNLTCSFDSTKTKKFSFWSRYGGITFNFKGVRGHIYVGKF